MFQFKDRFVKIDTLHGLYLVPIGILGMYVVGLNFYQIFRLVGFVSFFHVLGFQHVLHLLGFLIFAFATVEGLRKFFRNPIKHEAHLVIERAKYIQADAAKKIRADLRARSNT